MSLTWTVRQITNQCTVKKGGIHKGCLHPGGGREGVSNNADKSEQGQGRGLAVSGHPIKCSLCKREESIPRSFYLHLPVLTIKKQRGEQEISKVCMSFLKSFYFAIVFGALYLSSNSVSARTGGGGCEAKNGQAWTGGGRGLKTGRNVRTSFMNDSNARISAKALRLSGLLSYL